MEVLGAVASGVTLVAVFKSAVEVFDLIRVYQTQDVDFKKLQLRYDLEKCRLYNWGTEMGLANNSRQNLLDDWHSRDLVTECLRQIIGLFSDAQCIRDKYGCIEAVPTTGFVSDHEGGRMSGVAVAFDNFAFQSSTSPKTRLPVLRKSKWVVRDRKKFLHLIEELRILIDSLQNITNALSSTARLEEALRVRIEGVPDVDTLLLVASVWKKSHPRVASAASTIAESISISSGRQGFVSDWQTVVGCENPEATLVGDLEDLTITELKHSVLQSNEAIAKLKVALEETTGSTKTLEGQVIALQNRADNQNLQLRDAVSIQSLAMTVFVIGLIGAETGIIFESYQPIRMNNKTSAFLVCLTILIQLPVYVNSASTRFNHISTSQSKVQPDQIISLEVMISTMALGIMLLCVALSLADMPLRTAQIMFTAVSVGLIWIPVKILWKDGVKSYAGESIVHCHGMTGGDTSGRRGQR